MDLEVKIKSRLPVLITIRFCSPSKRAAAVDYGALLLEELKDPDYAVGYLTAGLEEGEGIFLVGLRNVAKACGGMQKLSAASRLNRESLYDMLSIEGNPRFSSLNAVLHKLGIGIAFKRRRPGTRAA